MAIRFPTKGHIATSDRFHLTNFNDQYSSLLERAQDSVVIYLISGILF